MLLSLKNRLRTWLNGNARNYREGKNVMSVPNPLYVASLRSFIEEGETVQFPVRGWSMRIFVEHERDKAILKACDPQTLKKGDVVLTRIDTPDDSEVYVLHRIIATDGQRLTLMGDGNQQGTETCRREDVVALVTGFLRKGRTKPDLVTSRKWRIYSWWWTRLRPLRRWLILLWRIKQRLTQA